MVQAWTTYYSSAYVFNLNYADGGDAYGWISVRLYAANTFTEVKVILGNVYFFAYTDHLLFPLTWSRLCLSLDTVTGRVVLVLDGRVLEERVHQEAREEDVWRPYDLDMVLGFSNGDAEDIRTVSQPVCDKYFDFQIVFRIQIIDKNCCQSKKIIIVFDFFSSQKTWYF